MLMWLSTVNMMLCRSVIFSELSFLLCKMGIIIPSSQDCCAAQKDHVFEILAIFWIPRK